MAPTRSVAIIGAGPAGAIAVDTFAQEKAFDVIKVFERQEKAGGCWVSRDNEPEIIRNFEKLASRTADAPLKIPDRLPAYAPPSSQQRFIDSPVYPALETNVDDSVMAYSQEPIPAIRSEWSIARHGHDTPFRHHSVIREYIEDLLNRNGYQDLVQYNTTVEKAAKDSASNKWVLTLRKGGSGGGFDYWWTETFDALVVASGHYAVPYIPEIRGLKEFAAAYPGRVEHTKQYRGPEKYRGKRVITVGASVSAADTAVSLIDTAELPIYAVVRGRYNPYFGDEAFKHPKIQRRAPISHISSSSGDRTVHFEDGTSVSDVDHIIFGTGFTWTLPFLPDVPTRNNRVPNLYQHVFYQSDPTLVFLGALGAGLTFKVFEWQAVAAARVLAGKATLPPVEVQRKWEVDRIARNGDGPGFMVLNPDFEEYFEHLRILAGEPGDGEPGRRLPKFDQAWKDNFDTGHERRIRMWKTANAAAIAELQNQGTDGTRERHNKI
ncbi:hypothetical protein V1520DRAFT_35427 [Lipomyces starkeyi]|uniref:FAD/NAD(P)-binding domain-containing protein n=1 Tax=Lipomyces starkeyi NRRL Y-11557 TaxID=675824 RepID=A0A1E3Q1C7_LIPST|nr:hypothetical protein LIPSTDRAFT_4711 [Lipomyces starkeyi NRRL Y-11557]